MLENLSACLTTIVICVTYTTMITGTNIHFEITVCHTVARNTFFLLS